MALRPSLFSRWLTQPTALLHRTTLLTRSTPSQSLSVTRYTLPTNRPRTFTSLNRLTTRTRPRIQVPRRATRRANSSSSSSSQPPKEGNSLSQRLRTLSREYGWAALGVYLGLSALDFPFCFVAVRLLGVERIGQWEHVVVQSVKDVVHSVWPQEEGKVAGEGDGEDVLVKEEGSMEEASTCLVSLPLWGSVNDCRGSGLIFVV